MSIYPKTVDRYAHSPEHRGDLLEADVRAKEVTLVCGSFVAFSLRIDAERHLVRGVDFRTNGCGYMIAAADVLAGLVRGRPLTELHGLAAHDLREVVADELGPIEDARDHCVECSISALRAAFAEFRRKQIEEFRGEQPLVCTCFGVTEEAIEKCIAANALKTVDQVAGKCNAGSGCGSCRMLIQEIIDSATYG